MRDIEIKVGQKWRVIDAGEFYYHDHIDHGHIFEVNRVDADGHGRDNVGRVLTPFDISNNIVELIEDTFDSITHQIPPVGTKCLYSFDKHFWWECEVVSQNRPVIYCPHLDDPDNLENGLQIVDAEAGHYITTWYKPLPEPKSATHARMEEIEAKMRELADELQELNNEQS